MFFPDCPEDIIYRYQDTVYRIAFTYCRNTADAQDIAQEVFFRYLKKTPRLESEEHLKAWLIRVTLNVAKSLSTSSWSKKVVPLSEHDPIIVNDENTDTDTYYAVLSLAEKYRSVIMLYYYEDYSVSEISQILNRTETAIQTQLQRARAMLKSKLKEEWSND